MWHKIEISLNEKFRLHVELDGQHPRVWHLPNTLSKITDPTSDWVGGGCCWTSWWTRILSRCRVWYAKVSVSFYVPLCVKRMLKSLSEIDPHLKFRTCSDFKHTWACAFVHGWFLHVWILSCADDDLCFFIPTFLPVIFDTAFLHVPDTPLKMVIKNYGHLYDVAARASAT